MIRSSTAPCPRPDFSNPTCKHPEKHRLLNRVLRARSALLLSKGRGDDALATQILMLRLTRQWRREPLMIGYLVTVACELGAMEGVNQVLQAGPVSPSARQALDTELALHDTMDGYNWALRSERAYSLSSIREFPALAFWLTRGFGNDAMLRLIELYDRYLEKGSRPYAEVVSEQSAATRPSDSVPNLYGALVTLLEPSLAAIRDPAERTRAMSRSLRVLNAIQARVPSGSDQVPKLTDLGLPERSDDRPVQRRAVAREEAAGGLDGLFGRAATSSTTAAFSTAKTISAPGRSAGENPRRSPDRVVRGLQIQIGVNSKSKKSRMARVTGNRTPAGRVGPRRRPGGAAKSKVGPVKEFGRQR